MFSTTFLGHQGWLFQSERACVAVDPLLCDELGASHALAYAVWPPRVLVVEAFPKLDAVVLSHEHDDHFDIASLAKLDRAIPIYLSARSSTAARQILATMGFAVHPLVPGVAVRIGDLEVVAASGDHVTVNCGDEWDTLPYLVRHVDGHGSLFSLVDITITQGLVEWAAAHAMRTGLVTWTNNALDWSHMASYLHERVEGTQQCFVKMGVGHKLIESIWGTPAAMLICAGGFSFTGELAWLNQRVFCVDTDVVAAQMAKVYRKERFFAAVPGQTFHMQGGKLKSVDAATPWLSTAPVETWPSRAKANVDVRDYAPATGREGGVDLAALRRGLDELAGAMVGGKLFRSLHSLVDTGDREPTFAIVARGAGTFAYDAPSCSFVDGNNDPERVYIAGIECWATDLEAVLAGELGPIALTFGRARLWNALAGRFDFDIFGELHRVSHPLRKPAAYLRTYERLWRECAEIAPVVARRD